jgi:protocatechuate 3,4-dioxygenase beta subunit
MHVIEPGRCTYTIADLMFTDDPRRPGKQRSPRGGPGPVTPKKVHDVWRARRDITLGEDVPGYEGCKNAR